MILQALEVESSGLSPVLIILVLVFSALLAVFGFAYYVHQQRIALQGSAGGQKKKLSRKKAAKEARYNRSQFSME